MAERRLTLYHSDLTGAEIGPDGAGLEFSFDGVDYEIDLTEGEHAELREALAPYIAVARQVRSRDSRPRSPRRDAGEPSPRELRAWAQENGFDLPTRGRIPQAVREAYKAANQSTPAKYRQPPWRARTVNQHSRRRRDSDDISSSSASP